VVIKQYLNPHSPQQSENDDPRNFSPEGGDWFKIEIAATLETPWLVASG
jgi:hypothetical protein